MKQTGIKINKEMGVATKNGRFEVSFSCLHACEFHHKAYAEAPVGHIMQVHELSSDFESKIV